MNHYDCAFAFVDGRLLCDAYRTQVRQDKDGLRIVVESLVTTSGPEFNAFASLTDGREHVVRVQLGGSGAQLIADATVEDVSLGSDIRDSFVMTPPPAPKGKRRAKATIVTGPVRVIVTFRCKPARWQT